MSEYDRVGICTRDGEFNPIMPRLISRTVQTEDGCWLYQGPPNNKGVTHSKITYRGIKQFVHRLAWILFRGNIPQDKKVLHKCVGRGNCWNPTHLYLGTDKNNAEDRERQGRGADHRGVNNGRCKLTPQEVIEIRGPSGGFTNAQIGEMYGISESHVRHLRARECWSHL